MTDTPSAGPLTPESQALLDDEMHGRFMAAIDDSYLYDDLTEDMFRDRLAAIEDAAVRRDRETGCEGLREAAEEAASWLELRPDYTEGDAATASRLRAALAAPAASPEDEHTDWQAFAKGWLERNRQPATASAAATSEEGGE